jgi:hypothetical protein
MIRGTDYPADPRTSSGAEPPGYSAVHALHPWSYQHDQYIIGLNLAKARYTALTELCNYEGKHHNHAVWIRCRRDYRI